MVLPYSLEHHSDPTTEPNRRTGALPFLSAHTPLCDLLPRLKR